MATLVLGGLVMACVAPKSDYDDYMDRTAATRGPFDAGVKETTPIDAERPAGSFDNTYHVACMPSIFRSGETGKTLQFKGTLSYVPGANEAAVGTLSLTLLPLKADATALNQDVGSLIGPSPGTLDDKAALSINVGTIVVPGSANPGTGADIRIENGVFGGTLASQDKFCIKMYGKVTEPVALDLGGVKDFCIFQKYDTADATVKVYTKADFDACQ